VRYSVKAVSSTHVLSSPEEGTVVQVDGEQLVKAFGVALKTMKQGEKVSLNIKPECEPPSPSLALQTSP